MLKKPHIAALAAVSLLVILLLSLPSGFTQQVKLALSSFFLPIFGLSSAGQATVNQAGNLVASKADVLAENEKLLGENRRLKIQLQQVEAASHENAKLREMIGMRDRVPWKIIPAKIIARDPDKLQWWRTLEINVGRRQGVSVNAPVITTTGLAGKISSVSGGRARVILLGDPLCQAAALVKDTGENGVIKAYPQDPGIVILTYLSRGSGTGAGQAVVSSGLELRPGNEVLTSGLGGIFPDGIPIGEVVDVRSVGFGLYDEARVRLAVDYNQLNHLFVIVP
jgi:rod shape-determining protein MreC